MYKKIEKSMVQKGEVQGLKVLRQHLQFLEGVSINLLTGDDEGSVEPVTLGELPQSGQDLEHKYGRLIAELVEGAQKNLISTKGRYLRELSNERKRKLKKDLIDTAEAVQVYMDALTVSSYESDLNQITATAQSIIMTQVNDLARAGKPSGQRLNARFAQSQEGGPKVTFGGKWGAVRLRHDGKSLSQWKEDILNRHGAIDLKTNTVVKEWIESHDLTFNFDEFMRTHLPDMLEAGVEGTVFQSPNMMINDVLITNKPKGGLEISIKDNPIIDFGKMYLEALEDAQKN